jgi:hypothetical protein
MFTEDHPWIVEQRALAAERAEERMVQDFGDSWEEREGYGERYLGIWDFEPYDEGDDPVTMYYMDQTCEHGLSAWLCVHPIFHYPSAEMEMRGEYY